MIWKSKVTDIDELKIRTHKKKPPDEGGRLLPMSYLLSYTDVTSTLVSEIVCKDKAHASLYMGHTKESPR